MSQMFISSQSRHQKAPSLEEQAAFVLTQLLVSGQHWFIVLQDLKIILLLETPSEAGDSSEFGETGDFGYSGK